MIKIGKRGIFKRDIMDIYFDNEETDEFYCGGCI